MLQESLLHPRPAWLATALTAIGRHEFLTAAQVGALVDATPATATQALDGLVAEGTLVALMPTWTPRDAPPLPAYALTRQGADLVVQVTEGMRPPVPDCRRSLYQLGHELARNSFGIVLDLLDRAGRLRLLRYDTARTRLADAAEILSRGAVERIPLVPDALATVEINGRVTTILCEIDRGTVSATRMTRRYHGYLAWCRAGGAVRRHGASSVRVITLVPTKSRLERLRAAIVEATMGRGSGLFLLGEQSIVDLTHPERFLDAVFTEGRPGAPHIVPLMPS